MYLFLAPETEVLTPPRQQTVRVAHHEFAVDTQ
jgi:hypothetical protein